MVDEDALRPFGGHVPTIFANYFHIAVSSDLCKIVFGEAYPDQQVVNFHTSIALKTADIKNLVRSITHLLERIEEQNKASPPTGPEAM